MGKYSDELFSRRQRVQRGFVSVPVEMATTPDPALKGQYGGNCNITRCQKPGAFAWSLNNHAYYCDACARMLNNEPSNQAYWKGRYGINRFVFRIDSLTPEEIETLKATTAYVPGVTG